MTAPLLPLETIEETRIAVAFSGGVALAVYESGVAVEFFRLVADDAYAPLRKRIGRVVVDVIAGTSAGGLNGAFLANALVNQGDIWQLLPLWRDKADLDVLLYPPTQADPQSLLDGDYFRDEILNALAAKGTGAAGKRPLQDAIDLFITGTNLDGERVDFATPDGEDITTQTYRQVFHFQFRDDGADGPDNKNDFRGDANIQRLAIAARTTASFPGAFAPVLIDKAFMGPIAENLAEAAQSYHIDGGVLDNRPISLAVQAIDARSAAHRVMRHLFYVEPDPDVIRVRSVQAGPQPYSPPDVIYQALVGLTSYQSITNALEAIEQRNRNVARRRRALDAYEQNAGAYQQTAARTQRTDDDPLQRIEADGGPPERRIDHRDAFLFAGPVRFDSAYFRAVEDGYLDLRLRSLDHLAPSGMPTLFQCFDGIGTALGPALQEEAKAGAIERATAAAAEVWPLQFFLYQLKSMIVAHLDLRYYRRYYDYLTGAVLKQYPDKPTGPDDGNELAFYQDAVRSLNEIARRCSVQIAMVRELERTSANAQMSECIGLVAELQAARAALARLMAAYRQETSQERRKQMRHIDLAGVLQETLRAIQERSFQQERCGLFNAMRRGDGDTLRSAIAGLLRRHRIQKALEGQQRSPRQAYLTKLAHAYWSLRDALESFYLRDMMLYPVMDGDEVQAELEEIRFARISPADSDVFRRGLSASDKLAGELLWHFGGFLKSSWRGNDLVWGRLDAAEIIVKRLWPGGGGDEKCLEFIRALQAGIIDDMRKNYGMVIFDPPNTTEIKDLIGKQTMSAVSIFDRCRWLATGTLTSFKILANAVTDGPAGRYIPTSAKSIVGKTVGYATGLVLLFGRLCKWAKSAWDSFW